MHPPIRFLTTRDNVRIACCTHGDGPPLVFARGWLSHLELLWEDPPFNAYWSAIASKFRLVRFDMRTNGLSDRDVPNPTLEDMVLDIEAVMDEMHIDQAILYGSCFAGPATIAYAARHPERVSKLILDGTYADGNRITSPRRRENIVNTLRDLPDAGYLLMSHYTHPEPHQTRYRRLDLTPQCVDAPMGAYLYTMCFEMDVSDELANVKAPTLVMHREGSMAIPFRLGRELAAQIPGARFVALAGTAHNSWEGDARPALAAVGDFLGTPLQFPEDTSSFAAGKAPLTILFTDIEESTALTQQLGDVMAQEMVRAHNNAVRSALLEFGGREIKHTGDGIMASFASADSAVTCAEDIQRVLSVLRNRDGRAGLRVRIGINAGEPVAEEHDLFGTSVQLAKRVCDDATPGQVLVTNVVRELCAGKGHIFVDHGMSELKGFTEPVHLYEADWRASGEGSRVRG